MPVAQCDFIQSPVFLMLSRKPFSFMHPIKQRFHGLPVFSSDEELAAFKRHRVC